MFLQSECRHFISQFMAHIHKIMADAVMILAAILLVILIEFKSIIITKLAKHFIHQTRTKIKRRSKVSLLVTNGLILVSSWIRPRGKRQTLFLVWPPQISYGVSHPRLMMGHRGGGLSVKGGGCRQ